MDNFDSAISLIINKHLQAKAIRILAKSMADDMEDIRAEAADSKARLRIIHKINRGKNKCIDNICQVH